MQKPIRTNLNIAMFCIIAWCFYGTADAARFSWSRYAAKDDAWYQSEEGGRVAENILSFQDDYGSWPKNIDTAAERPAGDLQGTFDNGATTGEMRFLARAFNATNEVRYKQAFLKGLNLILQAQYPTGGWPQSYPPGRGYPRYITFNDNTMVNLMKLLRDIAEDKAYSFVDAQQRKAADRAFHRGVDCILKCQIKVNGKRTVWCAQHDENDYSPRPARSYELVSLSGMESAEILKLLMRLDNPTPDIVEAVTAGVNWYKEAKVEGIRVKWINGKRVAVKDPNAPPLWGRFCEIETNRPFFCDRDGIPKYDYNQIGQERLVNYSWYGYWGREVLRSYGAWLQRRDDFVTASD